MSSIVHKLRRFRRLEPRKRSRLIVATGSITLVSALLRLVGYARCRSLLAKRSGSAPDEHSGSASASDIELDAWAVRTASETLPWASCLPQSLALWWLLDRRGVATDLHFGVRRDENELAAHAWLEWNGHALTDPVDPRARYTRLEGGQ